MTKTDIFEKVSESNRAKFAVLKRFIKGYHALFRQTVNIFKMLWVPELVNQRNVCVCSGPVPPVLLPISILLFNSDNNGSTFVHYLVKPLFCKKHVALFTLNQMLTQ